MKIITIFEVWMVSPNTEINGFKNINDGETRNFFFTDCNHPRNIWRIINTIFMTTFILLSAAIISKGNKNSLIEFFESFGEKNWCSEKQKLGITDKTFTDKQT